MSNTQTIPAELYARLDAEVRRREAEGADDEEFLTARQLAAILQVSVPVVRRLAREGRIPSVHTNSRLARFNLKAVLRALAEDTLLPALRRRTPQGKRPLEAPEGSTVDYERRLEAVINIDRLRERLFAKYGEMPDSTDLLREDRAH